MIKLDLPVYWNITKNRKIFVGMNWYQRANKYEINKVKQEYHELIKLKLFGNKEKIKGSYQVKYKYFYKNSGSDLRNVTSVIDKFFNDALQELRIIVNDNVNYYKESVDIVGGMDKKNPRIEIEVEELKQMEALKTFNIKELLRRQAMLDEKFDKKKTIRKRELELIRLAYHTELGEFLQEVKSDWNYWKNSTKEINKQRALEELSDMLHFSLSYVNNDSFNSRIKNKDIRFKKELFTQESYSFTKLLDFLTALYNTDEHFSIILLVAERLGATEEEFLQIHHEKWLKNMNERTKEDY